MEFGKIRLHVKFGKKQTHFELLGYFFTFSFQIGSNILTVVVVPSSKLNKRQATEIEILNIIAQSLDHLMK